jgi:uncharacterized membrane protein
MAKKKKKPVKKKRKAKKKPSKRSEWVSNIISALSYVFLVGLIVLLFEKKNKFVKFHAKQGAALTLLYLIPFVNLVAWVLAIYGFVMAIQGKESKIPLLYELGNWIGIAVGNK